ncbi:MAG: serine hydrolase [Bacteroidetes bacterium]|nr:MAG: serine hydrolase [Bacteroidota bacterium]PTM14204.1 MAG: serine hydrolase [Bacteroidota bacterium]
MAYLKWGFLLLVLALVASFFYFRPLLLVGTGYAAKMACSCHYLQGRELADIQRNELNFSVLPWVKLALLTGEPGVVASLFGLASQQARYVPGRGCVLVVDATMPVPVPVPVLPEAQPPVPLPQLDTLPPQLDTAALNAAVDQAFKPLPGGGTRAVIVLYQGQVIAERYAPGFDQHTLLLGWSMTKSITNALVGIMVKNGLLRLEQDHLFAEWKEDERAQITLADLLHMNSGLAWNEAYGSMSDATRMLYLEPDMPAYTRQRSLAYPPNTFWEYASGTTNLLSNLIRQTLTDAHYATFARDSLFAKVGMTSALIESDQGGTQVGSSYGWARAADWARFGQLYLQDGVWNGERILPEGWVSYSCIPAVGSEGTYGAQIWLRSDDAAHAPADAFMFRGFQDQRIVVIPSRQCVLLRIGTNADKTFAHDDFITGVVAALPQE